MHLTIVNGPNLNLLGQREPEIYGNESFEQFFETLQRRFPKINFEYFQSNDEGDLITILQSCSGKTDGVILNAAAYAHTSVALGDVVAAIAPPVVEVHISNVFAREVFRHHSFISSKCVGAIIGLGLESYALAVRYFQHRD